MKTFNYGGFYEKYNMEGTIKIGTGTVKVHDIFDELPDFMLKADVIFSDPPCSKGNLKSFYTKNDSILRDTYEKFNTSLFRVIDKIRPRTVFIEVFKSNKEDIINLINTRYAHMSITDSYYYYKKSNLCWIIQASNSDINFELPYLDEQLIIEYICKELKFGCIADPCMGRGLLGFYANKYGKKFVGTELNKKRLAVLIERINKGKINV